MFTTKKQWKKWGTIISFFIGIPASIFSVYVVFYPVNLDALRSKINPNMHYQAKDISRGEFLGLAINIILPDVELEERPKRPKAKEIFIDIHDTYKYSKEVYYARKNGIVTSKNKPRYNPEEEVTKKEMAVILSNILCIAIKKKINLRKNRCANNYKNKIISFTDLEDLKTEKLSGFKPYISHLIYLRVIDTGVIYNPNSSISYKKATDIIIRSKKVSDTFF